MKVRFLESSGMSPFEVYPKNIVVDLPEDQALRHIGSGAAVEVDPPAHTATDKTKTRKAIKNPTDIG